MAVVIKCPTCSAQVRVVVEGYVEAHDANGQPCSYTRTAHSGTRPQLALTDKDRDRSARRRADREVAKVAAERAMERRAAKPQKPPKPPTPREECRVCGRTVKRKNNGTLEAHTKLTTGRWCGGGDKPSEAQKAKNRKRRSVWAVGVGLPTLGRR